MATARVQEEQLWLRDLKNRNTPRALEEAGGLIDPRIRSLPISGLASIGVSKLATLTLFGTFFVAPSIHHFRCVGVQHSEVQITQMIIETICLNPQIQPHVVSC
jgi:hypothetical protein